MTDELKKLHESNLLKMQRALKVTLYSFNKIVIDEIKIEMDEETKVDLDALGSRFVRLYEVIFKSLIPTKLRIIGEFENDQSFLDRLNKSEKFGWIDDVSIVHEYRTLRNILAHDYVDEEWVIHYLNLYRLTDNLIHLATRLLKL